MRHDELWLTVNVQTHLLQRTTGSLTHTVDFLYWRAEGLLNASTSDGMGVRDTTYELK